MARLENVECYKIKEYVSNKVDAQLWILYSDLIMPIYQVEIFDPDKDIILYVESFRTLECAKAAFKKAINQLDEYSLYIL